MEPPPTLLATVQSLLAANPGPLTQKELLARWPGPPPHGDSLWRALSQALETGLFTATGEGTKNDPQRFALATSHLALPAPCDATAMLLRPTGVDGVH